MSKPENSKGSWADRVGNEIQYMARQVSRGRWPYSAPYTPGMLTLPHGQGVRFRKSDGSYRHPTSAEMANFRANEWGRGMGLSVNNGQLIITRPGLLPPVPAASQDAPGSTVPTLTAGTSDSNRRAEANRMRQQGGGGSTQSRSAAARPASPSAHTSAWSPGNAAFDTARAVGAEAASQRQANTAAGRPAAWGMEGYPEINPGTEAYWKRADIRQWANAHQDLANELRTRKGLPTFGRNADGSLIFDNDSVSPYANAFSQGERSGQQGATVEDIYSGRVAPLAEDPSSATVPNYADRFTGSMGASDAAFAVPTTLTSQSSPFNAPSRQATTTAYQATSPALGQASAYPEKGLMAPISDARYEGFQGEGLGDEFLKRFRLQSR